MIFIHVTDLPFAWCLLHVTLYANVIRLSPCDCIFTYVTTSAWPCSSAPAWIVGLLSRLVLVCGSSPPWPCACFQHDHCGFSHRDYGFILHVQTVALPIGTVGFYLACLFLCVDCSSPAWLCRVWLCKGWLCKVWLCFSALCDCILTQYICVSFVIP